MFKYLHCVRGCVNWIKYVYTQYVGNMRTQSAHKGDVEYNYVAPEIVTYMIRAQCA